ncbi:MAG: hypothetical protein O4808_09675, partial [Trichodesmium sp. St17_bin3_1_1]|nr:hypothetical protein [Trichodesmium sp. St17_bin3_1_1]
YQTRTFITSNESLELTVDQVVDYRKIGTALPLLSRFNISIDQIATITIQVPPEEQFVPLEYQGKVQGFQNLKDIAGTLPIFVEPEQKEKFLFVLGALMTRLK